MEKHSFDLWSPQLRSRRRIDVYLPAAYGTGRHPVVYLQDGQNLSDPATAFAGRTWQLDVALPRLAARGIAPIVVGVHHAGERRLAEYSPFPDAKHGGGDGDRYVRFLIDTVKPRVDATYRTRRDRDATAILGSSMGGLIALYAFFRRPSPFGRVGALSPSIWFGGGRMLTYVEESRVTRGRIYLDAGTSEGADTVRNARALARILKRKGYQSRDSLRYVEASGHQHREQDWAKRLPGALEFLLSEPVPGNR
ncbi:MAG: alpha/beta hydrolase [Vicinamibacterales bacterium]